MAEASPHAPGPKLLQYIQVVYRFHLSPTLLPACAVAYVLNISCVVERFLETSRGPVGVSLNPLCSIKLEKVQDFQAFHGCHWQIPSLVLRDEATMKASNREVLRDLLCNAPLDIAYVAWLRPTY